METGEIRGLVRGEDGVGGMATTGTVQAAVAFLKPGNSSSFPFSDDLLQENLTCSPVNLI